MAGKDNCAMCHTEGVMGATKMPASHEGLDQKNCVACHSAIADAVGRCAPAIHTIWKKKTTAPSVTRKA